MNRENLSQMMLCFLCSRFCLLTQSAFIIQMVPSGCWSGEEVPLYPRLSLSLTAQGLLQPWQLREPGCLQGWFVIHLWSIPALCAARRGPGHMAALSLGSFCCPSLHESHGKAQRDHLQPHLLHPCELPLWSSGYKGLHTVFIN